MPILSLIHIYLPLGQYYVKEIEAPKGYVKSDKIFDVDASYQGDKVKAFSYTHLPSCGEGMGDYYEEDKYYLIIRSTCLLYTANHGYLCGSYRY